MDNDVSIIIPVYRDWDRLALCVNAIANQTFPKDQFEVIIVNNDPNDAVPKRFILPENTRIISESKPGSYAARNAALRIAKGSIIGFTDSDCIPDKNWITNAVDYLSKNESCSRVAGHIAIIYKSAKPTTTELYNTLYSFPQKWFVENRGTSVTANLFTYRYVFDAVRLFDDRLMSLGDSMWSNLARNAGYQVHYVANVVVHHPARSLSELIRKEMRHGGGDGIARARKPMHINLYRFLRDLKPKRKELWYLRSQGKGLGKIDKFTLLCIRQVALSMRVYERFRVQMGKKPIRD